MTIDDWRVRYDGLNAEIERLRAEVDRLQADIMNVHLKRAMLVVQRDAAKAGEARAVEALSLIRKELGTIAQGYEEEVRNEFTSGQSHGWGMAYLHAVQIIGGITDGPALAWLSQQRREAAAEALDEAAEHCETTELLMPVPKPGTTLREHGANVCVAMAGELRQRAAALLAGAEALERLEAMESSSSTMLPKSASASEEQ